VNLRNSLIFFDLFVRKFRIELVETRISIRCFFIFSINNGIFKLRKIISYRILPSFEKQKDDRFLENFQNV